MRPCGWGSGNGDDGGIKRAGRGQRSGRDAAPPRTVCRLLMTVEDEDGGRSMELMDKDAVECQRVRNK